MNENRDLLLELAKEVAEGSAIDWEARLEELGDLGEAARVAAGLRRLAEIQSRFRDAGAGLEMRAGGESPGNRRWAHLQVGELLGSGSFGEVYRAYDPVLRREVALKLRARPRASAAESTFLAEARRLARVRHPNVLAVHGADVDDGRAGLWADLLEGETLEQGLGAGARMPSRKALEIALQLVGALAAVHGTGLVHGDVKASNVMCCLDGRAVLMDFGAGSDSGGAGGSRPAAGSPLSMAPELLDGRPATTAADLYATGVLLFRLLTGRYPVEAETLEELACRHRQGWFPPWRTEDRAPRSLRHLVERLLTLDPAGRPTAAEALEALRMIEEEPRLRRKRLAVAAVVGSLLAALGASTAGWLSARHSAQRAEEARREAEATSGFLSDLLLAPDITQQGPGVKVLDVMDEARTLADRNLADRPLIRGRILWLIGKVKASLGQGEEAMEIFRQSEESFAEAPGEGAWREGAEVLVRRARLLVERAELGPAEALLEGIRKQVLELSAGSSLRIQWMRAQAYLLTQKGRLEEAEAVFREALEAGTGAPGADGQALSLELAIVLEKQGKFEEAEGHYRRYLEWNLEEWGERHESTLIVRYNLGGLAAQTGRFSEAEELFRRNAKTARDWLGPQHRLHLLSLTGLAEVIGEQGRFEEAAELDRQVFPLADEVWGPDHPRTQILRANTAAREIRAGDYEQAEALLVPVIAKLEERLGPDAAPPLHARMSLAQLYLETGRSSQAAEVAEAAHRRALANLGEESPVTLGLASRLGRAWTALGRREESLPLLRFTLEVQRRSLGENSSEVRATRQALAEAEGR